VLHALGESFGLFLVLPNLAAQIGVKPDQAIDGGVIGLALNWCGTAIAP
jgi:hypothetical protein